MRVRPLDELLREQPDKQASGLVINDINRDETILGEGGAQAGMVCLTSSFTIVPRYMRVHYENAMGLVSRLGTFFLTFNYNAAWKKTRRLALTVMVGVFLVRPVECSRSNLLELLRDLRSEAMFGRLAYLVYFIKMQMRGLHHAHIFFKIDGDGPAQAHDINSVIRADIHSGEEASGRLRKLVLKHIIHGPCGTDHRTKFLR